MRSSLATTLALVVLASSLIGWTAPLPGEQPKAGFIYVKPAASKAVLRETPDASAKVVAEPPSGTRLVYRRLIDPGTGPTWFFVEHPGGKSGWIAAADTGTTRPTVPPPAKPIKVVDSGVGLATPSSAQTAAARGLSPMAKQYAEKKLDFKTSVDQFLTLETAVEAYFGDPHDEQGNYPDVTVAGRKTKAEQFRTELK